MMVSPSATVYVLGPVPAAVPAVIPAVAVTVADTLARGVGDGSSDDPVYDPLDEPVDVVVRVVAIPAVPATPVVVMARVPVTFVLPVRVVRDEPAGTRALSDGSGAAWSGTTRVWPMSRRSSSCMLLAAASSWRVTLACRVIPKSVSPATTV